MANTLTTKMQPADVEKDLSAIPNFTAGLFRIKRKESAECLCMVVFKVDDAPVGALAGPELAPPHPPPRK